MGAGGAGGLLAVIGVLLLATGFGLWRRRRDGRLAAVPVSRPLPGPAGSGPGAPHRALLSGLGVPAGARVTLVQFSSAFCAPCRATRVLCAEAAAGTPGVHHLDVDAESHLDAVRAQDIRRTPTLLVVDPAGWILRRGTGLPTREHLRTVVAEALAATAVSARPDPQP